MYLYIQATPSLLEADVAEWSCIELGVIETLERYSISAYYII